MTRPFGVLLVVAGVSALALAIARFDVLVVLTGIVLVLGLAVLIAWPDTATLLSVFLVYTNLPVVLRAPYEQIVGALSLSLLVIPLIYYLVGRRERLRIDWIAGLMVLYLLATLLSSYVAKDWSLAAGQVVQYVTEGLALYLLVLNVVRTRHTLRRVMGAIVLASGFLAALTVYQAATRSYTQQFAGLAQRQLRHEIEAQLDPVAGLKLSTAGVSTADRAAGPIGDPNRYAQILLVAGPPALYLFRAAPQPIGRLAAAGAAALMFGAVMATYSRGAFLTLGILVILAIRLRYVRPNRLVGSLLLATLATPFIAPSYWERISTLVTTAALAEDDDGPRPDAAVRGRATEMLAAAWVFLEHPFIGVGPGQYVPFYSRQYQLRPDIKFRDLRESREAHNLFVAIAAEKGVLGLGIFLAILITLGLQLARRRSRDPDRLNLASTLLFSLVAYIGTGLFLHMAYERYFWLLVGMAGALLQLPSAADAADEGSAEQVTHA